MTQFLTPPAAEGLSAEATEIVARAAADSDAPRLLPPDPGQLFARRSARLQQLAQGHPMGDWLRFMARLTAAQQVAADRLPPIVLPSEWVRDKAVQHHLPPLAAVSLQRHASWQKILNALLDAVEKGDGQADDPLPEAAVAAIAHVRAASPATLEALADRVLRQEVSTDVSEQPLVAAALQVYWSAMAAELLREQPALSSLLPPPEAASLCPCCGSPAQASIVYGSSAGGGALVVSGQRYLHCALCQCTWHLVRVQCSACGDDRKVSYQSLVADADAPAEQADEPLEPPSAEAARAAPLPATRAECCDACQSYLKIVYQDTDARVDPVADDLASLSLDLLLDEAGYQRGGPNLLLAMGRA